MILKVFTDDRYEQPTIVPITPNTKFSDVVACCRESGRGQCHLVEIWKGRERVVGYDERPFESIIQRGIGQDEIWFSLRTSASSGGENRFRDQNKSNHMPTSNRQITSNSNHHRESDMTLAELQDLATRQQQQLEEQQQLIVAREQRLKYLKQQEQRRQQTNNQNATLQTLLQHVYTQEQKLQQLRMSRGEAFQQVSFNNYWAAELDSLRELFKQKEKELAHVVDRVDILSKSLDSVVQKKVCSQENGASKNQTELGRLCAEVTYQNKRNEEQNSMIKSQQEILLQRTDEMTRINARVDDLRARLNLKRPDNSAAKELLVGTDRGKSLNSAVATVGPFVQQASFREGDQRFTKVDSKYQSLPLGGRVTSGPERLGRGSEVIKESEGVSQNRLAQNEMKISQPGNNRVVENSSANSSTSMNSNIVNGSRSWEFTSRTLPSEASRNSNNELKSGRTHNSSSNAETSPADDSKTGFRSADSLGYYSSKHSETNSSFTLTSPSLTLVSDRSMSSVTNSSFPNSPSPNVLSPKLFVDSTMESCSPISADPPTMYYKMPVEKGPILKMTTTTASSDYPLTRYMPPFTATIIMPSTNTTTSASSSIRSTESRHRLEHGTGNNSYGNSQLEKNPSLAVTSSYSQKATGRAPVGSLSTTVTSDEMQSTRYNNSSSEAANTMHIPLSHKSGEGSTRNGSMLKSDPCDNGVHGSNNISGVNEETKNKDGNNNGSRSVPLMFSPTALVRPLPPQTIVETNRTSTEKDYKVTTAYKNPGLNAVVSSNTKRYSMASPISKHWTDSSSQYFQSPHAATPDAEDEKSKFTAEQISASEQALDQLDGSLLMRHNAEKTSGPRPLRRRLSSSETNEETHKPLKWQMNRNSSDSVLTRKTNEPSKLNMLPSDRLVSTILGFTLSPLSSKISSLVETTPATPSSPPHSASNPSVPFSDGLASTSSTNQMPSDTVISERSISPQPPAPPSTVVSDSTIDDEHKNGDLFRNDGDGDDLDVTEEDQPLEGEPEPILIYVSPVKNAKKSNLKKDQSKKTTNSVRFDPLTLLLDASLQGELNTVQDAIARVHDPSISNDEGITALHNAICGGHFEIVKFLVDYGCDVNAADSDHWTPLHCAASCNNLEIVKLLVENGACVFATTESDNEMAVEKCEEDEEGYDSCLQYLKSIEEKMGSKEHPNVYAVFDYESSSTDELSFSCGDRLTVLKRGDDSEKEWWWARREDKEGYIPRNYFGAHPRIVTIR